MEKKYFVAKKYQQLFLENIPWPKGINNCLFLKYFTPSSSDLALQILRKAAQLRSVDGCKNIYISPDRTFEQRLAHRTLVEELKKKRGAEPEKLHLIRNFKIISVAKEATSSDS